MKQLSDLSDTQTHIVVVGELAMEPLLVPPGQTLALNFLAYKTGHFRVYCTVTVCTDHDYVRNTQFNVT